MVGPQTLNLSILVRIQVPQQNEATFLVAFILLRGTIGFEPQKGSGNRIFPVAELFKPRSLKEAVRPTGSSEAESKPRSNLLCAKL